MSIVKGSQSVASSGRPPVRRTRPGLALYIGAGIIGGLVLLSIWMTAWPPYGPSATVGTNLESPSFAHPLGTDNIGRDQLVRLALAARTSLLISGGAALLAAVVGSTIGVTAGYLGGRVDAVLMRIVDAALALPAILVALVVGVIIGTGPVPLIVSLGLIFSPAFARVMRAPVIALRERDYVLAAQLSGVRAGGIMRDHLIPNALTPLFVQFATVASNVVLVEAALSYLGQGVQAPEPSAGRMIIELTRLMQMQPLAIVFPSLLIVLLSAGWNLLSDGIQDYLAPRRESALAVRTGRRRPRRAPHEDVRPSLFPEHSRKEIR